MNNKPIKDWLINDRTREKFIEKGVESLSNTELLAILIQSGIQDKSVLAVAYDVLKLAEDNLSALAKLQMKDFLSIKGIGHTKAITLMTALELGRRRRLSEAITRLKVSSSNDFFHVMQPLMEDLEIEEFWVLYLNNANKVLIKEKISHGGMTATIVDVRLILKRALELNSVALVLCQNHPSGTLHPSRADVDITNKVKNAAQHMDIKVLDHIIITDQSYFSFADQGRI